MAQVAKSSLGSVELADMQKAIKPSFEVRRAELLDAAAHLFSTRGFHATGMRDIAHQLEIKAGSLYYHINSKEQLLSEVCVIGMRQLSDNVDRAIAADLGLPETVKMIVLGHVEIIQRYGHFLHCYQNEHKHLPPEAREEARCQLRSFHTKLDGIFRRANDAAQTPPDLDVKHARLALIAVLQQLSRPDVNRSQANLPDIARGLAEILVNGLARK